MRKEFWVVTYKGTVCGMDQPLCSTNKKTCIARMVAWNGGIPWSQLKKEFKIERYRLVKVKGKGVRGG